MLPTLNAACSVRNACFDVPCCGLAVKPGGEADAAAPPSGWHKPPRGGGRILPGPQTGARPLHDPDRGDAGQTLDACASRRAQLKDRQAPGDQPEWALSAGIGLCKAAHGPLDIVALFEQ